MKQVVLITILLFINYAFSQGIVTLSFLNTTCSGTPLTATLSGSGCQNLNVAGIQISASGTCGSTAVTQNLYSGYGCSGTAATTSTPLNTCQASVGSSTQTFCTATAGTVIPSQGSIIATVGTWTNTPCVASSTIQRVALSYYYNTCQSFGLGSSSYTCANNQLSVSSFGNANCAGTATINIPLYNTTCVGPTGGIQLISCSYTASSTKIYFSLSILISFLFMIL